MRRIVNIDWLSLYCSGIMCTTYNDFIYEKQPHGTPQFAELYNIIDKLRNQIVAQLERQPYSEIIPKDAVIVKFTNRILYEPDWQTYVTFVCDMLHLKINAISRIDICADFNKFKNGLEPSTFIKRFLNDELVRLRKTKFTVMGEQRGMQHYSYLRIGDRNSEVSAYLYNKTLELQEVKNKPWIRQNWAVNGLDDEHDVWRLEFSLRNKQMKYVLLKDDIEFRLDLDFIKTNGILENIYDCCYNRYWDFRINDGQKKRTRMRRIELFDNTKSTLRMYVPTKEVSSNRMDKIIIRKLYNNIENLGVDPGEQEEYWDNAAYQYAEQKGMLDYFYAVIFGRKAAFKKD